MSTRLLIADDDPLMRTLVGVMLQDVGEVVQAADGNEALERLAEKRFDLLLLDWDMPGRSGLEILQSLRESGSRLPVIMVTAEAGRQNVVEAIRSGVSDYLIKPFRSEVLHEKVEKFCRNRPIHRSKV
jgi:two-component system, chemotaxis family, chemotaxis protein CheY